MSPLFNILAQVAEANPDTPALLANGVPPISHGTLQERISEGSTRLQGVVGGFPQAGIQIYTIACGVLSAVG